MSTLPSITAIRAFEAAARHGCLLRVAAEMGISQAAVSDQIQALEDHVRAPLLWRQPSDVALTPAGAELARPTIDAFERLRAVYTDTDLPERRTLTISATPTFATRWLSPRIARFRAENPGLSVRLRAVGARLDFGRDDVDVAIRFGRRPAAGQAAQALMRAEFTPMLSPKALHEMGKPGEPADLLRLGLDGPGGPHWATWLRQAGVDPAGLGTGIGHDLEAQLSAAQTAIAGLGIAMLNPRLFRDELAAGRLVQPFDLVGTDGRAYWLVCPEARAAETGIARFRAWLTAEAAQDVAERPVLPGN